MRRDIFSGGARVGLAIAAFLAVANPAQAQGIPVFDASSFAQLEAGIQQGATEISNLEQQLQAQLNMLKALPSTIMPGVGNLSQQTESLMQQVTLIQNMGDSLKSQLESMYPTNYGNASPQQILSQLSSMQSATQNAYQTSIALQNQVAANQSQAQSAVQSANAASMAAAGPTAAAQASNQLLGVISQQLADEQTLLIADARGQDQSQLQDQSAKAAGDALFNQTWQPSTTAAPPVPNP